MDIANINLYNIILIYISILLIFKYIENSYYRFFALLLISLYLIYLFKIKTKILYFYIIITLLCVLSEIIFIQYFNNTWFYYNKQLINVPIWLITLWFIAITFIFELYKILT